MRAPYPVDTAAVLYNYLPMEHAVRFHKTLTQLRRWPLAELQALAEALDTLRAARARTRPPGPAGRRTLRPAYVRGGMPGGSLPLARLPPRCQGL